MKRPTNRVLGTGLLLILAAGLAGFFARPAPFDGSTLSRGSTGWLAARRYLAARGAQVTSWKQPLDRFQGPGVLVLAFPWQHSSPSEAAQLGPALEAHLRRGGDLVFAYSGQPGPIEKAAADRLQLSFQEVRKPPFSPLAWRRFTRAQWQLAPAHPEAGRTPRIWAPRSLPELAGKPDVWFRTPSDSGEPARPVVAALPRHRGRIWLLPADSLANARLGEPGNADLLETLLARLGPRWTFDEYHHGLVAVEAGERSPLGWTFDLLLLHLVALYGLAAWAVARRFGPAWRESEVRTGSVASFLLGLGALHHRLGHHRDAARGLLARTGELHPDLPLPEGWLRRAESAGPAELIQLARAVARLRRGSPSVPTLETPDA